MGHEFILTERHDDIAVITLNRPEKLNALSFGLVRELDEALTEYESDDAVKAVILTGAGERAFSAGADIHEMAGLSGEELAQRQTFRGEATWHIASFAKPLIGAINGLAYGGAALLSSTLDLRIGCERTQFRFLAASYGRVNSTWSLPLLVGLPKAKELLYTGRVVGHEEAERIGLLNQVVPAARLIETAVEIAHMIAKNDFAHGAGHQAPAARRNRHGLARPLCDRRGCSRLLACCGSPARRFPGVSQPQTRLTTEKPRSVFRNPTFRLASLLVRN